MAELIFEKYEIRNRLAVGGMGEVFFAVQTQRGVRGFERPVILKSLLPDLASQDGFIDQFLDEARVAATLNHPNVVSIYEVGLWNGVYFIAMEYIAGRNIAQLMRQSLKQVLPVPPSVIAHVVHGAALGLDHAHNATDSAGAALNIVHRDISPQNIMVREDGVTKVVDFGIARASNRASRTATGAVKGKLAYMAPEQLLSKPLTGKTDQFGLGVVLWEMCAGRRLFLADRDVDLMRKVLDEPIVHPATLASGLPEELGDIAMKMVQRDPEARYASLADAARDLSSFLHKVSPPSSESPVKGYMKQLVPADLTGQNRATPSNQNFVIALGRVTPSTGDEPPGMPLETGSIILTTPEPIRARAGARSRKRVVGALAALVLVGVGGGWFFSRATVEPPPVDPVVKVEPAPVAAPLVPPAAPTAAPGTLSLSTVPAGASVRFDGRPFTAPVVLEGAAGSHVFLVEKPGFRKVEFELAFEAGVELKKEVKLEKLPAGAKPRPPPDPAPAPKGTGPGFLRMATEPWTNVWLGTTKVGMTPFNKAELPPGKHTLRLVNEKEKIETTREVIIRSGELTKFSETLR